MRALLFNLLAISSLASFAFAAPTVTSATMTDTKEFTVKAKDGATQKDFTLITVDADIVKNAMIADVATKVTVPNTAGLAATIPLNSTFDFPLFTGHKFSFKHNSGIEVEIKRDVDATVSKFKATADFIEYAKVETDCPVDATTKTMSLAFLTDKSTPPKPLKFSVGAATTHATLPAFHYLTDLDFDFDKAQLVNTATFSIYVAPAVTAKKVNVLLVHSSIHVKVKPAVTGTLPVAAPPAPPVGAPSAALVSAPSSPNPVAPMEDDSMLGKAAAYKWHILGGVVAIGAGVGVVMSGVLSGASGAPAVAGPKKPVPPRKGKLPPKRT